ncbi:hypothetical protein [Rhodococcus qingshengii]|uniref:hypothetical protein n=1 Tax=Rhodococcus qingshengii TaxID=334542 RepID=UPI0035E345A7
MTLDIMGSLTLFFRVAEQESMKYDEESSYEIPTRAHMTLSIGAGEHIWTGYVSLGTPEINQEGNFTGKQKAVGMFPYPWTSNHMPPKWLITQVDEKIKELQNSFRSTGKVSE